MTDYLTKPPQRMDMVEEARDAVDIIADIEAIHQQEIQETVTQDRHSIHTSLVAAVEGKRQNGVFPHEWAYNQALDDTLTIINSIFKE